jgi:gluconate kinase
MGPKMLNSQIAALEPVTPSENVITVDGLLQPNEIVDELMVKAIKMFPGLEKPWWQRCTE